MQLNRCENLTDRLDRAAAWATRHEFRLRRTWWRRIRYGTATNGVLSATEALKDLARALGGR